MLSAPTSPASIMAIGPHHAAVTHVGGSSEVGQREHMVRPGFTRKCWSEFLCLGGYLAPPLQVGGFVPRDALGRCPSADPRPPLAPRRRARGRSPIGSDWVYSYVNHVGSRSHMANDNIAGYRIRTRAVEHRAMCSSAFARGEEGATGHNLRSASPRITRMAVGSSNGR
jgi:hypothetical protein